MQGKHTSMLVGMLKKLAVDCLDMLYQAGMWIDARGSNIRS